MKSANPRPRAPRVFACGTRTSVVASAVRSTLMRCRPADGDGEGFSSDRASGDSAGPDDDGAAGGLA